MAWIDEQRAELVQQKGRFRALVSTLFTWGFVVGCFGLAAGGAYTMLDKNQPWQLSSLLEAAKFSRSSDGLREPQEAEKKTADNLKTQLEKAISPSTSEARLGTRANASFLSHCKESFGTADATSFVDLNERARTPDTPAAWEQRFMVMDAWSRAGGLPAVGAAFDSTGKTRMSYGSANRTSSGAVGEFVACALARTPATLCNRDNRAAAVLYLSSYFGMYETGAAAVKKLSAQEKASAEKELNPFRHKRIEADLEKHAKAGTIRLADVGLLPDARVREILARHEAAPDSCAKPR